jgi:hypothetical protein
MSERRLRDLLQALHDELGSAQRLAPDIEADLRSVMGDIRDALDRADTGEHEGLRERLSEHLDHFETDHPRLALTVRRVLDTMSRLSP